MGKIMVSEEIKQCLSEAKRKMALNDNNGALLEYQKVIDLVACPQTLYQFPVQYRAKKHTKKYRQIQFLFLCALRVVLTYNFQPQVRIIYFTGQG